MPPALMHAWKTGWNFDDTQDGATPFIPASGEESHELRRHHGIVVKLCNPSVHVYITVPAANHTARFRRVPLTVFAACCIAFFLAAWEPTLKINK